MQDLTRAVRFVRAHAAEWGLDPKRVGAFGISGGGHLASCVLTRFDAGNAGATDPVERASSRPDLGVLCYAAVSMGPNGHGGSRKNLLGDKPSDELIKELSNELHVTKETPPCFLFHTGEDTAVKMENSLEFAAALRKNGVPFALHIYPKGRHGIGLGTAQWDPEARHPWTAECALWLKEQGWAR
jgi:acetyl esterase/lipase